MATTPITATGATTTSGTPTAAAQQRSLGKDDFLKLLVEQLKQQDPTKPTDMNAMTAQMTQFGILEQLTNLAKAGQETNTAVSRGEAIGLLGRTVTWTGADDVVHSGTVERVDTSGDAPTLTAGGIDGIALGDLTQVR